MRFFNTTGPCDPQYHYMLPAVERLPDAPQLIESGLYFVVHAPRQTGKTTTLRALAERITGEGKYAALHFSCEAAEVPDEDYVEAPALRAHGDSHPGPRVSSGGAATAHDLAGGEPVSAPLHWAERVGPDMSTPAGAVFDEIDALRGKGLQSVLRQLRAGFNTRPRAAPWSVALCGLRDVRDYKIASGGDGDRLGTSSPFNIKVKSMRLGNFSEAEVAALYAQHTADTGQPFTPEAVARAFELTAGQPWLVNALAREILNEMRVMPPEPITTEHIEEAKERLILARATHLDSLVARLSEDRVRRIMEPLLAGGTLSSVTYDDDAMYVHDLGLIALEPEVHIANPIYREVIARVLARRIAGDIRVTPSHFLAPDGRLELHAILRSFAAFWRTHRAVLTGALVYHEVAPQLVLMAYLQSVVNGTGFIDREYGVGRGRIDLQLRWPYQDANGQRQWQREAVDLKVWRDKKADPLDEGLSQLDEYLGQLDLNHGVLVIFDRRARHTGATDGTTGVAGDADATPAITFEQARTASGRDVTVLRA